MAQDEFKNLGFADESKTKEDAQRARDAEKHKNELRW